MILYTHTKEEVIKMSLYEKITVINMTVKTITQVILAILTCVAFAKKQK